MSAIDSRAGTTSTTVAPSTELITQEVESSNSSANIITEGNNPKEKSLPYTTKAIRLEL